MAWHVAYSHNKYGIARSGKVTDLINAIEQGSSVKVIAYIVDEEENLLYKTSEYAIRVWIHKPHVFASTLQYHYNFSPRTTRWQSDRIAYKPLLTIWGTNGMERVVGRPDHHWTMDWCVD